MKRFGVVCAFLLLSILPLSAQTCGSAYTIRPGDSLSKIAEDALGSIFDYDLIHEANRGVLGRNPNSVEVGLTIYIPCRGEELKPLDWSVLPEPATVAELMRRGVVQVLDIRSGREAAAGAVPGSVRVPFDQWRGPAEAPGAPPSEAELNLIIGKAGLRLEQPVVILHSKDYSLDAGRAAHVYWLLKSMGAERLALLNGGFNGWAAAGLPVAAGPPPAAAAPYAAAYEWRDTWRATAADVAAVIEGRAPGRLLDARPPTVYRQIDRLGQIVPTTLPGALNAPVEAAFRSVTRAQGPGEARQDLDALLRGLGVDWGQVPVISFGATGELAALNWFYSSELLGLPDVRLYPESTRGWLRDGRALVGGGQPDG